MSSNSMPTDTNFAAAASHNTLSHWCSISWCFSPPTRDASSGGTKSSSACGRAGRSPTPRFPPASSPRAGRLGTVETSPGYIRTIRGRGFEFTGTVTAAGDGQSRPEAPDQSVIPVRPTLTADVPALSAADAAADDTAAHAPRCRAGSTAGSCGDAFHQPQCRG